MNLFSRKNLAKSGIAGLILLATACMKDYDFNKVGGIEWDPILAAPLVNSSISINDILALDNSIGSINVASDNFVTLVYNGNLFSLRADEFFALGDQSKTITHNLTGSEVTSLLVPGATITVPYSGPVAFDVSGNSHIDSIFFSAGSLTLNLSSDFQHSGSLQISIPSLTKNGVSYLQTIPLPYSGFVPVVGSTTLDLSNYKLNLSTGTPNYNQIPVSFTLTLTNSGQPVTGSEAITTSFSLSGMKFKKVFGIVDLDQYNLFPAPDTVEIGLFNNSIGSLHFTIVDPVVDLKIYNSFGIPIQATFDVFQGYNPHISPSTFDITSLLSNVTISAPTVSQIGQDALTTLSLAELATDKMLENTPPYVIYKLSNPKANPSGLPTPPNTNFVLDTSRFKVDIEIELPLYGTAKGFAIQDTVDNYTIETSDIVENFMLRTWVSNGYPCEVRVQIYFTDSAFNKLDSLITSPDPSQQIVIPAAQVDASGKAVGASVKTTDITMDMARITRLNTMKHLLVRADGTTTDNATKNVKIYADYQLQVKMGAKAKMKMNMNLKN